MQLAAADAGMSKVQSSICRLRIGIYADRMFMPASTFQRTKEPRHMKIFPDMKFP